MKNKNNTKSSLLDINQLICVGLNYKNSSINIRELIAFTNSNIEKALKVMIKTKTIDGAVIISTCNRVEIYAQINYKISYNKALFYSIIENFFYKFHKLPDKFLKNHLYKHLGKSTIIHLFRVACSLDSLVVGEPQVLGQIKKFYLLANKIKSTSPLLNYIFTHSFITAKRVRRKTSIGESAVTVSFAAVELAKKILNNLNNKVCLLIGAGEMGESSAQHIKRHGATLTIINRSIEKSKKLALRYQCEFESFQNMEKLLCIADVVLISTSAQHYLISKIIMQKIMPIRKYKPIFIVDIAVPRNVDPKALEIDGVFVYDMDDLGSVVGENKQKREIESKYCETIIQEEILKIQKKLNIRKAIPLIYAIQKHTEKIIINELNKKILYCSEKKIIKEKENIKKIITSIMKKILHIPIVNLKNKSQNKNSKQFLNIAKEILLP